MSMDDFFARHPAFSLGEAAQVLKPAGGRSGTLERLKYHVRAGRLKRVAREVYATVPRGQSAEQFRPDMFLVAAVVRPDGIFSYHSALELQGVAHSAWFQCTLFCAQRRPPLTTDGGRVLFLSHPAPLRKCGDVLVGTQQVEYRGQLLRVTGPERTLVEGFRRLDLVGGVAEFLEPVSGFPVLDLDLLERVLRCYSMAGLWAAAGWLLEMQQVQFHVPESFLQKLEALRPRAPQYLVRSRRSGRLVSRWNLILPPEIDRLGEPNER